MMKTILRLGAVGTIALPMLTGAALASDPNEFTLDPILPTVSGSTMQSGSTSGQ